MSDVAMSDLLNIRPLPGSIGVEQGSRTDVRNAPTHPTVGTVCAILPTYNEAENHRRLVPNLESQLAGKPSQILIIDDASSDDTISGYGILLIHALVKARFGWPALRTVTKSA
jgi:hypothetical protein